MTQPSARPRATSRLHSLVVLVVLVAAAATGPDGASALPSWGTSIAATWVNTMGWTLWDVGSGGMPPNLVSGVGLAPATYVSAADGTTLQMLGPGGIESFDSVGQVWLDDSNSSVVPLDLPRIAPASCTATDGTAWVVFGGQSTTGELMDDLWINAGLGGGWTLYSGNGAAPSHAPPSMLLPGARRGARLFCVDASTLVLFGGVAVSAADGTTLVVMNDVWEFDIATSAWSILVNATAPEGNYAGDQGVPNAANSPPARELAASWFWAANNAIYVFGGSNSPSAIVFFNGSVVSLPTRTQLLSDMWRLDLATQQWVWLGCGKGSEQLSSSTLCPLPRSAATPLYSNQSTTVEIFGGFHATSAGSVIIGSDLWSWDPSTADATGSITDGSWLQYGFDDYRSSIWFVEMGDTPEELLSAAVPAAPGWVDINGNMYVAVSNGDVFGFSITRDYIKWTATCILVFVVSFSGSMLAMLVLPRLLLEKDTNKAWNQLVVTVVIVSPSILNVSFDALFVLLVPNLNWHIRGALVGFQLLPSVVPILFGLYNSVMFLSRQHLSVSAPDFPVLHSGDNPIVFALIRVTWWLFQAIIIYCVTLSFVLTMISFYIMCIAISWTTRLVFCAPFYGPTFGDIIPRRQNTKPRASDVYDHSAIDLVFAFELLLRTLPIFVIECVSVAGYQLDGQPKAIAGFAIFFSLYMLLMGIYSIIKRLS